MAKVNEKNCHMNRLIGGMLTIGKTTKENQCF